MRTSETITKIAAALLKAQKDITPALRTADNPYFKSKYVPLEGVVAAVKEPLNANGITFLQADSSEAITERAVMVTTTLLHESGEWIEGDCIVPMVKPDPQAAGSAYTYARRYGLAALCGVVSEQDDDAEGAMDRTNKPPKASDARTGTDLGDII